MAETPPGADGATAPPPDSHAEIGCELCNDGRKEAMPPPGRGDSVPPSSSDAPVCIDGAAGAAPGLWNRFRPWVLLFVLWGGANLIAYWLLSPDQQRRLMDQFDLPPSLVRQFQPGEFSYVDDASGQTEFIPYRLLKPPNEDPGELYPLLISLHGAGDRGRDNLKTLRYLPMQMAGDPWRDRYPCFLLVPQCPRGRQWDDGILQAVFRLTSDIVETYPVDRRRVYLTGYSMGGYGAGKLAAMEPDLFAAVVPICGGGDPADAEKLAKTPIWAVHGDQDEVVPPERSQEMIDAVRAAGGTPRLSILNGVGHNSWMPAYSDLDGVMQWMFEQTRRDRVSE